MSYMSPLQLLSNLAGENLLVLHYNEISTFISWNVLYTRMHPFLYNFTPYDYTITSFHTWISNLTTSFIPVYPSYSGIIENLLSVFKIEWLTPTDTPISFTSPVVLNTAYDWNVCNAGAVLTIVTIVANFTNCAVHWVFSLRGWGEAMSENFFQFLEDLYNAWETRIKWLYKKFNTFTTIFVIKRVDALPRYDDEEDKQLSQPHTSHTSLQISTSTHLQQSDYNTVQQFPPLNCNLNQPYSSAMASSRYLHQGRYSPTPWGEVEDFSYSFNTACFESGITPQMGKIKLWRVTNASRESIHKHFTKQALTESGLYYMGMGGAALLTSELSQLFIFKNFFWKNSLTRKREIGATMLGAGICTFADAAIKVTIDTKNACGKYGQIEVDDKRRDNENE